jgi:hypothetical protein
MKVFCSHSHDERRLAKAWKLLFERIAYGIIESWFSSDLESGGGIGPGRWRKKICRELKEAGAVLAIFTPESISRPWIFFESAYAMGLDEHKMIIPVVYYMRKNALPSPLRDQQSYQGDDRKEVIDLCRRLWEKDRGVLLDDEKVKRWAPDIEDYLDEVEKHSQERMRKALFYGDFHTSETAKKLEGKWFAKWTKMQDDGEEILWQIQPITITTTEWRIQMVGEAKQGVLSPFEGVVSSEGKIPLTYWVQGQTAICGTVLLKTIGNLLMGIWNGYTARTLEKEPSLVHGRVVMSRDKSKAEEYWDIK